MNTEEQNKPSRGYAIVTMFDKWRRCQVERYGEPQDRYEKEQTLWVERGEDYYAMRHYKRPFCVLTRESWMQSEAVYGMTHLTSE